MSLRLKLLTAASRFVLKPTITRVQDPQPLRILFERFAALALRPPPHTLLRETLLAPDMSALIVSNRPGTQPPRPGQVVLYVHGGAFMTGSPRIYAALAARISRLTLAEVVLPAYRLAPEHPFPAAVNDIRAAWNALIARGYAPEHIVLGGDSAGGNLALGLLATLLAEGLRPAGLFAFSPVTDLTFSGASITENVRRDPMLPASRRNDLLRFYLDGARADDPQASPLFADYPGPPPVFLQYAETEILRDDCRRLAEKLRLAGGSATCDEWPDAPHVWVLFDGLLPEAREGLGRAAGFINQVFDAQAKAADPAIR